MIADWPPSAVVALAGIIIAAALAVVSWIVDKFSKKWGWRIALLAFLFMLQGSIMSCAMWVKE